MTKDEALKLALEALESMKKTLAEYAEPPTFNEDQAIIAVQEALAQPEQPEPPPWWPAVENILKEYGLQAIDFVADFKKALAQPEQKRVVNNCKHEWMDETKDKPQWRCIKCGENYTKEKS